MGLAGINSHAFEGSSISLLHSRSKDMAEAEANAARCLLSRGFDAEV